MTKTVFVNFEWNLKYRITTQRTIFKIILLVHLKL